METSPAFFPSELLNKPGTPAWAALLAEARRASTVLVRNAGGSYADGEVFFQTAATHAASLAPETLPESALEVLTNLTEAHYRSWLEEHGQPAHPISDLHAAWLPTDEVLRAFRKKVFAWKRLRQLGPVCREKLVDAAADKTACLASYLVLLFPNASERPTALPDWVADAVADEAGYNHWLLVQQAFEEPIVSSRANRPWIRYVFFAGLVLTGIWVAYRYLAAPIPIEKVYASNFTPPESLMADLDSRTRDTLMPESCRFMFAVADEHYQAGEWEAAQEPLLLLAIDSTAVLCQSDAWFYLGILRLALDDPQTAIECFAKIENLDAFGEDLYWYQGLAFVKLAAQNPSKRDLARRAVERAVANSSRPERKQQAAEMLKDLSD